MNTQAQDRERNSLKALAREVTENQVFNAALREMRSGSRTIVIYHGLVFRVSVERVYDFSEGSVHMKELRVRLRVLPFQAYWSAKPILMPVEDLQKHNIYKIKVRNQNQNQNPNQNQAAA